MSVHWIIFLITNDMAARVKIAREGVIRTTSLWMALLISFLFTNFKFK